MTPVYPNIDLIDYIDIKITNTAISFNTNDLFNLIKDIKYVLYLDFTCSSVEQFVSEVFGVGQQSGLNRFKQNAERIEGNSITKNIETNNSSYNNVEEIEENIDLKQKKHLNRERTTRKEHEVTRMERVKLRQEQQAIMEQRVLELKDIFTRIKLSSRAPETIKLIEVIEESLDYNNDDQVQNYIKQFKRFA
jgi:hypothetical protein